MNSSYNLSKNPIENSKSIMFWLVMIFVTLFFYIFPFQRALFNGGNFSFERPIYMAIILGAIALFIMSIIFFRHWKLEEHRDVLSLLIWLVPLSHLISVSQAASHHAAMLSVYIHVLYAVFFLIGLYFTRSKVGRDIILYAIVGSGYMVVFFGWMNWFEVFSFHDAIIEKRRLSSVFQYPNTFAAYLTGLLFACLLLITLSKRWYITLLHSLMLVPIFTSFFLTSSRGGMVTFPFVLVIFLLFLPIAKQCFNILLLLITGIASFLIIDKLALLRSQLVEEYILSDVLLGLSILIIISMLVSIVTLSLYIVMKKGILVKQKSLGYQLIIPISLILLGIVTSYLLFGTNSFIDNLPRTIKRVVSNISLEERSVLSRTVFYSDSIELIKGHPIIGAGGGAWSNMYLQYQSYPYTSRQAHNFFLQYLVEVGWVGFLIFIIIITYVLLLLFVEIKSTRKFEYARLIFLMIIIALLSHSMIDFDISYVYLGSLLFLCFGAISSNVRIKINKSNYTTKWRRLIPISIAILSGIIFIITVRNLGGNTAYYAAINESSQTGDYVRITEKLDRALEVQRNHPDYVLTRVSLLNQMFQQTNEQFFLQDSKERINQLLSREPYYSPAIHEGYLIYLMNDELDKAHQFLKEHIGKFPWDIKLYEDLILLSFQIGYDAMIEGSKEKQKKFWDEALKIYDELTIKREYLDTLPKFQRDKSKGFVVTPNITLTVGKIHSFNHDFEKASSILKLSITDNLDDPINKEIMRWYLVSLQISGNNDKQLYDSFIEEDPSEMVKIQLLIESLLQ